MFTLDNFYTSKEWIRFREQVITDRTSADGFIYDEVTGKPILQKFDMILHHKEYLTEDNVNDYSVSLNPDNIMIVSHHTHNLLHHKFGYKRQEIYLVYGAPFAGKHRYVTDVLIPGDLVIDIDSVWSAVSGCERYIKPARLNAVVFGVRDYLLECIKYRRGKWQNAYIIGGYPLISERERLCKMYGAREVFIDTPKEECLLRLEESSADQKEYTHYIEQWFYRYIPPVAV